MSTTLRIACRATLSAVLVAAVACGGPATEEEAVSTAGRDASSPSQSQLLPRLSPACFLSGPAAPADPDNFNFVVFGDSQSKTNPDQPVMMQILTDMMARSPGFAMSLGDVIVGEDPKEESHFADEIGGWCGRIEKAAVPVFNAPGNHELVLWNKDHGENPVQALLNQYQKLIGSLDGYFDYGNSRFIAMNTDEIPAGGEKLGGKGEHSFVSAARRALIENTIKDARSQGKTHVFLFSHYPLMASSEDHQLTESSARPIRDFLAGDADARSVMAFVVGSHEHQFWQPGDAAAADVSSGVPTIASHTAGDGARYLVTGGAGAPLDSGGFFHYLGFEVRGDTVNAAVHKPAVALPVEPPPG